MQPSSFEKAIRLQFDCLICKVIDCTVKNYNREIGRRAKHERPFCEVLEIEYACVGTTDEYSTEFMAFQVFGSEVRVHDERLGEAIMKLSEKQRNILLIPFTETECIHTECVHFYSIDPKSSLARKSTA